MGNYFKLTRENKQSSFAKSTRQIPKVEVVIKLSAEEILRIAEVNDYSAKQIREAFESLMKIRIKNRLGEKVYDSQLGYVMTILSGVHEILTRSLDNSETNGTAKGTELSE